MQNAKTGLRMLSFSIILNAVWAIVSGILSSTLKDSSFLAYGTLISSIVALACYVIELLGLFKAGKDNERFHRAGKLKIINIGLAVLSVILSAVLSAIKNPSDTITTVFGVIAIIITVAQLAFELLALVNVIKGCREIAPRVSGLSKFVYVTFCIYVLCMIVATVLTSLNVAVSVAAILLLVVAVDIIVFAICYLILIFRTTANVGKARK